jgi:hypothetical protein
MKGKDDFDEFLNDKFQKSQFNIEDEGFTDRIVSNLPACEVFIIKRKYIIYLAGILSFLIFLVSGGCKSLIISMIDIFNNGIHRINPSSLSSLVVLSVFIGISFFIARIEYNKNTI